MRQAFVPGPIIIVGVFLRGQVAIDLLERERPFLLAAGLCKVNLHGALPGMLAQPIESRNAETRARGEARPKKTPRPTMLDGESGRESGNGLRPARLG